MAIEWEQATPEEVQEMLDAIKAEKEKVRLAGGTSTEGFYFDVDGIPRSIDPEVD